MKKETREIIIDHPDLGKVKKKVVYTYDETKYSSLDECLKDHELMEKEKKAAGLKLNETNKKIVEEANKSYTESVSVWRKSVDDLHSSYQKKIDDLKKEYEEKSKAILKEKPEPKDIELNKFDNSKFEGRGYIQKEAFTEDVKPKSIIEQLAEASPEEKEVIREMLLK